MRHTLWGLCALALTLAACGSPNVFELSVGDCFDDPPEAGAVSDVPIVDCDTEHDNEVYAVITLEEGDFPGESAFTDVGDVDCVSAFGGYVGIEYAESELASAALTPTEAGWDDGDRDIVCVLYDPDGRLVGSMENAER